LESALLVAITYTFVTELTLGAVKTPALEIVPPDAVHVTPLLSVPVTVAVKVRVCSETMFTLDGDTVKRMPPPPPPPPELTEIAKFWLPRCGSGVSIT